jgi:hypothetical protein
MNDYPTYLEELLQDKLSLSSSGLVGCARRNAWAPDEAGGWRHVRGNALLAHLGDKYTAYVGPDGMTTEEFFARNERWLLQFRGGPWSMWWVEDFYDLWSIAAVGSALSLSPTIVVLNENKGDLDIKYVTVPDTLDPEERVDRLLAAATADPPERISKADARALRVCSHCPVRTRCNTLDKLHHEDLDWSPTYRSTLVP